MSKTVICGAGIAGIATAYYLSRKCQSMEIILVNKGLPMSLTTRCSGENFRDYWPQPCVSELVTRSIALMEEIKASREDAFDIHFTGYDFVSEQVEREIFPVHNRDELEQSGVLKTLTEQEVIHQKCPYLSPDVRKIVHIAQAGTMDVNALGIHMLSGAKRAGANLIDAEITAIERHAGGFCIETDGGKRRDKMR